jgi:hypothetical protein
MTTFHQIKDPSCLKKFSLDQLCSIERSSFQMYLDAQWRLERYSSRPIVNQDHAVALSFMSVMETNQETWLKIRSELISRIDDLLTLDDILNIPVSTAPITQGHG